MAYEAMNNAGVDGFAADRHPQRQRHVDRAAGRRDERLSVARAVLEVRSCRCAISATRWRGTCRSASRHAARRAEELARSFVTGGTLFEELGFYYVGPIDGHNIDHLLPVLKNVRDSHEKRAGADPCRDREGPRLSVGRAGRGQMAQRRQVRRRDRRAGQVELEGAVLHQRLRQIADQGGRADDRIVAITAAMPSGTGLNLFERQIPEAHASMSASPSSTR